MRTFTYPTPPATRVVDGQRPIDAALVDEVSDLLRRAIKAVPASAFASRRANSLALVAPMAQLCTIARRNQLSIERLIIAIKQSWTAMPDLRAHLGDAQGEVLAAAITVCIEEYFAVSERQQ